MTAPLSWTERAVRVWEEHCDTGASEDLWCDMLRVGGDARAAMQKRWPHAPEGLVLGVLCACEVIVFIGEEGEPGADVLAALRGHGIALSDDEYELLHTAYCSTELDAYGRIIDVLSGAR